MRIQSFSVELNLSEVESTHSADEYIVAPHVATQILARIGEEVLHCAAYLRTKDETCRPGAFTRNDSALTLFLEPPSATTLSAIPRAAKASAATTGT
ncbi:MAG: hypothetical protein KIH65_001020 [Candidatus Uhrbacteria bacterium]|nr:hypothetical protein [Candidatus Uhrbacteria bacterium]